MMISFSVGLASLWVWKDRDRVQDRSGNGATAGSGKGYAVACEQVQTAVALLSATVSSKASMLLAQHPCCCHLPADGVQVQAADIADPASNIQEAEGGDLQSNNKDSKRASACADKATMC
jgi:hypothetical protein